MWGSPDILRIKFVKLQAKSPGFRQSYLPTENSQSIIAEAAFDGGLRAPSTMGR